MFAIVCLTLNSRTKTTSNVGMWFSLVLDERRFPPRAVLDESRRQQPQRLALQTGTRECQRLGFSVQMTSDNRRPIVVAMETGLQNPDEGPVLDPDWQSALKTELHFWNGCEQEDTCVPDLILHSNTDLINVQQFCSFKEWTTSSFCSRQSTSERPMFVVESRQRRVVVFARLENKGENAYGTAVHMSTSPNLLFSSLLVKDQPDIQMECFSEDQHQRSCNISAPYMKSLSQVNFRLEFEFSQSVFLDHAQVVLVATSEGDERYLDDNKNDIFFPLKYQADLLFSRDPNPPSFEIGPDPTYLEQADISSATFNLTYYIGNMGMFSVRELQFRADIWAVTMQNNQLVNITDYSIEQQEPGSYCSLPNVRPSSPSTPEDLSHLPQLNHNNSMNLLVQCRLNLAASREVKVTLQGRLLLPTVALVKFKSLELLTAATVQLEVSSPMFLKEDRAVREIVLSLRRKEKPSIPIWIILGSSLGGLLLLGLLVMALWKLGFFNRRRREEEGEKEGEEHCAANGKNENINSPVQYVGGAEPQ